MESAINILEKAIEELKKPTTVYIVTHGLTGNVDSAWTNKDTLLKFYKSTGFVQKECDGNLALFPEELTYNDMYKSSFYKVEETILDKVSKS